MVILTSENQIFCAARIWCSVMSYSVGYCVFTVLLMSYFQAVWYNACQDALNKLEQLSHGKDAAELIQSKVLQVPIFFYFGLILSGPIIYLYSKWISLHVLNFGSFSMEISRCLKGKMKI